MTMIEQKELNLINKTIMLGTLAHMDQYSTIDAVEPYNNGENIVFYIEPLSTESYRIEELCEEGLISNKYYRGLDNFNNNIYPFDSKLDYKILSQNEKINKIYDSLDNKVLLFSPRINAKGQMNLAIEEVLEDAICDSYETVPVVKLNNENFEKAIKSGSYFELTNYSYLMPIPNYIICGEYIYTGFNQWNYDEKHGMSWKHINNGEGIKKLRFPLEMEDYREDIIMKNKDVAFLTFDYLDRIDKAFEESSLVEIIDTTLTTEDIENDNEICITKDIEINKNQINTDLKEEYNFFNNLKQYSLKHNLSYNSKDLVNFHISVKTNPLTIVAGMSGTGKTQLAKAYANVLGLKEDENLLFLPIRPSYTEPEDIIGYYNASNYMYIPSETGLVDLLIHAQNHPDEMHMVVFDEMNLSQIEYWFAPFMSLLELKEDERILKLYSKHADCKNGDKYKNSIKIGSNIIFIGTVNLDETTKEFSDRLLDRANIVNLSKQSFLEFSKEKKESQNNTYSQNYYSASVYRSWIENKNSLDAFEENELMFLDELHSLIQKYDKQKGVSFRILEKIGEYINNIPKNEEGNLLISKNEAFDIEIKQRFLTKIKGTERQFRKLIGYFNEENLDIVNSELYDFFDSEEAKAISSFEKTKEEIRRKSKELALYGYTN